MSVNLSVVIPTFRSPTTLGELVERILGVAVWTDESEILIVDDGNTDETWDVITSLAANYRCVRGFRLQQNFGQHSALLCGIRAAKNDVIVTLDDDLQNPPEEISRLLEALTEEVDVVIGKPNLASHSTFRRFTSDWSKEILSRGLGYRNATLISPFRLFRTRLRGSFGSQLGPNVSIDALLALASNRFRAIYVQHDARTYGNSNYSLKKLSDFFLTNATSASVVPLKIATKVGAVALLISLGLLFFTVSRRLIFGDVVTGFPFLASLIAATSGVQLLMLGILGQYIGHMHFRMIGTPSYVVVQVTEQSQ
jgi:undecaprenyl-phosphate 4-deoxy-4-formamido-L-arabinose transferase